MPDMVLSAENMRRNTKDHGIHSHDVFILLKEIGNRASAQLLNTQFKKKKHSVLIGSP